MNRRDVMEFCAACFLAGSLPLAAQARAAGHMAPLWGYLGMAAPMATTADAHGLGAAKLSLLQAVSAADQNTGGQVLEIGFSNRNKAATYNVTIGAPDGLHFVRIDAATGAISNAHKPDITRAQLDQQGLRDLDTLRTASVPLSQAIMSAEALAHGKAISAGIEQLGGVAQYYVQLAVGSKLTSVIVNPRTGRAAPPLR